jgi:hypothetical protein
LLLQALANILVARNQPDGFEPGAGGSLVEQNTAAGLGRGLFVLCWLRLGYSVSLPGYNTAVAAEMRTTVEGIAVSCAPVDHSHPLYSYF